jgi:hypothetical protein
MKKRCRQRELWEDLPEIERKDWTRDTDKGSILFYTIVFFGSLGIIALMLINGLGVVGEFLRAILLGGK